MHYAPDLISKPPEINFILVHVADPAGSNFKFKLKLISNVFAVFRFEINFRQMDCHGYFVKAFCSSICIFLISLLFRVHIVFLLWVLYRLVIFPTLRAFSLEVSDFFALGSFSYGLVF